MTTMSFYIILGIALRNSLKHFGAQYLHSHIFCKEVLQNKTKKLQNFAENMFLAIPSLNRQRPRNRVVSDTNKFSW
jgi:hypothetical protein